MRARRSFRERLEQASLNPLAQTTRGYYLFVFFLALVVLWGAYAYALQVRYGLRMTGMRDVVMWGFYLANFVFYIGIGHAGTFISAILRITRVGWRHPITRMAELVTVFSLMMGALMPLVDLGRPDRVLNLFWFGRFQSPLIWDIVSITSYLSGSIIYLYLPLIPDLALMRDRLRPGASALKRKILTFLAVGWRNTPEQRKRLEKAMWIMAVTIVPVMISVHTVVSFVFSMTLRPGWDSTIFGIYFVIGALFSGLGTVIVIMAVFRKFYRLEEVITVRHFRNMGYLMLVVGFLYLYLTASEYITIGYKLKEDDIDLLRELMVGKSAFWFWFFWIVGAGIPILLIMYRKPTITRVVLAAILINIAMWIKRFFIIIGTLQIPLMPFEFSAYTPTWVEISIVAGSFAGFMLLYAIAAKLVPVVSVWEVAEETETTGTLPSGEREEKE